MKNLFDFLMSSPNVVQIILNVWETGHPITSAKISWNTGITYSHVVRLVLKLDARGIVSRKKNGRTMTMTLTDKGNQIAERLYGLYCLCETNWGA